VDTPLVELSCLTVPVCQSVTVRMRNRCIPKHPVYGFVIFVYKYAGNVSLRQSCIDRCMSYTFFFSRTSVGYGIFDVKVYC